MNDIAAVELGRELERARGLLDAPLIICGVQGSSATPVTTMAVGDTDYIPKEEFVHLEGLLGNGVVGMPEVLPLSEERAAFSTVLRAATANVSVGLIAVEPSILPEELLEADELGPILPWAIWRSNADIHPDDLYREAQSSLSTRAFLMACCYKLDLIAAILWAVDPSSKHPACYRIVESWGVQTKLKTSMNIPIDMGVIGAGSLSEQVTVAKIRPRGTVNSYIPSREGWRYCAATHILGGGQVIGAISFYSLDSLPQNFARRPEFAEIVLSALPLVRRFRRIRTREVELANISKRLDKMQIGIELLGFAHDLAESAEKVSSRSSELVNSLKGIALPAGANTILIELEREAEVVHRVTRSMNRLAKGQRAEIQMFELADVIKDIDSILHAIANDITINIPKNIYLRGNPLDVQRIVINLVTNSQHWSPKDKPALISLQAERLSSEGASKMVRISVSDNGRGMNADQVRRAPTMLYSTRPNGLGLGLFVVKRLAEGLHGKLQIKSIQFEKTIVMVDLPTVIGKR